MKVCIICFAHLCIQAAAFRSLSSMRSVSSISALAADCQCNFAGTCSCDEAMRFMSCVEAACTSGECSCEGDGGHGHYIGACGVMSAYCPAIGLQCEAGHSTCGDAVNSTVTHPPETLPLESHKALAAARLHGNHMFALVLFALFVMVVVTFAMTQSSNSTVVSHTYSVIDSICVTTMAVTLFWIMSQIFKHVADDDSKTKLVYHIVYALIIFFFAIYGSYLLRDNPIGQASFNAVIFWVCLLAKGGALTTAQSELPSSLTDVCLVTGGALLFFMVLLAITHQIKPEAGWYDGVETGLAAGALAAGVCNFVGILINGLDHHPEKPQDSHKILLTHLFAFFTFVAAVFLTPVLQRIKTANKNYWYGRFLDFISSFVGLMPYFTIAGSGLGAVLCSLWQVHPAALMAKLVHAVSSVVVTCIMTLVCAFTPYLQRGDADIKALLALILGLGGWISGYALATLLFSAVNADVMGRDYGEKKDILVKAAVMVGFNALLLPIYVLYLKPLVEKKSV